MSKTAAIDKFWTNIKLLTVKENICNKYMNSWNTESEFDLPYSTWHVYKM